MGASAFRIYLEGVHQNKRNMSGKEFNPRPPAEGDLCPTDAKLRRYSFQSTPSCGGRPRHGLPHYMGDIVSIHALLRRATSRIRMRWPSSSVSIHALLRRATGRTPVSKMSDNVSIHALLRRATTYSCSGAMRSQCFNPRPPAEGDATSAVEPAVDTTVSIHALLRRATRLRAEVERLERVSIHALLRRATISQRTREALARVSIHALLRRATNRTDVKWSRGNVSIHALLRRAT